MEPQEHENSNHVTKNTITDATKQITQIIKHQEKQVSDRSIGKNPYIHAATSDNTRTAYRSDIQHFSQWGGLLPASAEIVIQYLQAFAPTLNPRTLRRRLTAIKNWHTYQGFTDPTNNPIVRKTITGITNVHGKPKDKAQALTLEHLQQMISYLQSNVHKNALSILRNVALLQVGFFGAFRRSELVAIKFDHINFVPEGVEIMIPRSKTDQGNEGQICAIPYGDETLCPVTALKNWCEAADITAGFVFRNINKYGNMGDEALLGRNVSLIIKKIAKDCGLNNPQDFSGHSLRRGFATTASRKGAPFIAIMRHGRWRHEGTVLGYVEEGQRFEENAAKIVLSK